MSELSTTVAPQGIDRTSAGLNPNPSSRFWFYVNLLVITAVSAYDTFLVVQNHSSILEFEQNPICRFLIQLDYDTLSVFLVAKIAGTSFVVTTLLGIYTFFQRIALPVVAGLSSCQLVLLAYLTFS